MHPGSVLHLLLRHPNVRGVDAIPRLMILTFGSAGCRGGVLVFLCNILIIYFVTQKKYHFFLSLYHS